MNRKIYVISYSKIQLHKYSTKIDYQNKPNLVNKSHRNINMPKLRCKSKWHVFFLFRQHLPNLKTFTAYAIIIIESEGLGKESDDVY